MRIVPSVDRTESFKEVIEAWSMVAVGFLFFFFYTDAHSVSAVCSCTSWLTANLHYRHAPPTHDILLIIKFLQLKLIQLLF
uniref:Uncharacterized protein n=1 Tax=Astyanax mexicanus TaxID=7994 RepID=A0A3B1J8T3_ASTMX